MCIRDSPKEDWLIFENTHEAIVDAETWELAQKLRKTPRRHDTPVSYTHLRSYLKEHRPIFYTNLLTNGTLHRHLAEIDHACNERMEIIVSAMVKQEGVTEALKAADQMEWVPVSYTHLQALPEGVPEQPLQFRFLQSPLQESV